MKKLFFCTSLLFVIAFGGISASAQCDRNTNSPIRCGFYDEGYQDGIADANANRPNNYRRYRTKYVNQYESFYSTGYNAGFDTVRPTVRWTNSQRNAYNSGYTLGQNDRRNGGQGRGEGNLGGRFDQNIGLYFQQGYTDGFDNRPRRYDFALDTTPTYPGNPGTGTGTGSLSWRGRIDDRANLVIRGGTVTIETISGRNSETTYQSFNGVLPSGRASVLNARKTSGRGEILVTQNPDRSNNYTAIIQIYDPRDGADNYAIDISWSSAVSTAEPYRSGSVRWRGRVDQTANIVISGTDVQTQDASGTGLSGVSFDINGYLARRPGSVTARNRSGRGTVSVLQNPSWDNNFTAIVQVFDPSGGADDYEVDINW